MEDPSTFGAWVRRRRKTLDLTQEALAERVGCALDTIRKIESGARRPSRQIAQRLADQLDLPVELHAPFLQAARTDRAIAQLGIPPPPAPPLLSMAVGQVPYKQATADRPSGTLTFLCTDIEGSTQLWERHQVAMANALVRHNALLQQTMTAHQGFVFKMTGDGIFAAFTRADDALLAAVAAQQMLLKESWGETGPLKVRMILHTGIAEERDGDYVGLPLNRAARLLSAGHGGQILLSRATQELVYDHLPPEVTLQDMGVHQLRDLTRLEHIFQIVASGLPTDFPPLTTCVPQRVNLPRSNTPLIGREREITIVHDLLRRDAVRLLTLTGPGGTGKTRLAQQVAAESLDTFPDGVFFVNLAPINDPSLVASTIAQSLGIQENGGQVLTERLKDFLHTKQLLLVLDNFEQVLAAATIVTALLATTSRVKILVTSRRMLHVYDEYEFVVSPLTLPDLKNVPPLEDLIHYDAVRLFIERALAVRADFTVTQVTAPTIAEICVRLDGLPLALELAAVRSKIFTPQALLRRLTNRLTLLVGGAHYLPSRQQTLRNTIQWSYDLLNAGEQRLFRRLGVFVGGCTLEAAETICSVDNDQPLAVIDELTSLVNNSLLQQKDGIDGEPRFIMLETIREYALEQMLEHGEHMSTHDHHARYYVSLAEASVSELEGPQQAVWFVQLEAEHDNMRAALTWALTHDATEVALRIGGALGKFWHIHSHLDEGRHWFAQMLVPADAPLTAARATALFWDGVLIFAQDRELTLAQARFEHSLAYWQMIGDQRRMAGAIARLGMVAMAVGDPTTARRHFEASFMLIGDHGGSTWLRRDLGELSLWWDSDRSTAYALFEECLCAFQAANNRFGIANVLISLGDLHLYLDGDLRAAYTRFAESLSLHQELQDTWGEAECQIALGFVALEQGDTIQARALFTEHLFHVREIGNRWSVSMCLEGYARLAGSDGRIAQAARLFGAVERLREDLDVRQGPTFHAYYERHLSAIQHRVDDTTWRAAWTAGRALTLDQAIAEALTPVTMAESIDVEEAATSMPTVPASYPAGLTAREVEILQLVAQGLTDVQVAERLVISPRTVGGHLQSIYSKLDVTSRTAATRFAIEHHLV